MRPRSHSGCRPHGGLPRVCYGVARMAASHGDDYWVARMAASHGLPWGRPRGGLPRVCHGLEALGGVLDQGVDDGAESLSGTRAGCL
jgi:hypothetical protein